jgi:Ca2+-binding EF-hand superfamily protein
VRIREEIKDLNAWLSVNKVRVLNQINNGYTVDEQKIIASQNTATNRIEELQKQLQELETKPDKKISSGDVLEIYKFLKEKISKKEVEEMIWEVDENLDECIDWQEFRLMFNRNIMDKTGLEPSRMVLYITVPAR